MSNQHPRYPRHSNAVFNLLWLVADIERAGLIHPVP